MSIQTMLRGYAIAFPLAAVATTLAVAPLLNRPATAGLLAIGLLAFLVLLANFLLSWRDDRTN